MPGEKYWWIVRHTVPTSAFLPGTDELVHAHSNEELWSQWNLQCERRGIALQNPVAQYQDACCRALTPEKRAKCCAFVEADDETIPKILRQARVVGWDDIQGFFKKSAAWLFKSTESVSQDEAERRAGICQLCPMNDSAYLPGCPSCTGIFNKIAEGVIGVIGGKHTSQDSNLKHCRICACNLRILVHCPLSVLQEHRDKKHEYPSFCWQVEDVQPA